MLSVRKTIEKNKLFKSGDVIGVGVSGGIDSMCLLHYLNSIKEEFDFELTAINIDHCLREESASDSAFVADYCRKHGIRCLKFKVDANLLTKEKKLTIEEGAREARYGVFESLVKQGIVDSICLAHHKADQAETILLNLLRGTGLKGASGMQIKRNIYVRPMLNTEKLEILSYAMENGIPYVEDKTNMDNNFSRNFLRNEILPQLKKRWPSLETNLLNFGKICNQDDDYINSLIDMDSIIAFDNMVKIPLSSFLYPQSILSRILRLSLEKLGTLKDFETKHFNMIRDMAREAENGVKINLPNNVIAHKEYDFMTFTIKVEKPKFKSAIMQSGTCEIVNFGNIFIKKTKAFQKSTAKHIIDANKLPNGCTWRLRQEGDMFKKLGSAGSKKLKDYYIDRKIPSRIRTVLPVLAKGKEVYVVANYDISDLVKIDDTTTNAFTIDYKLSI